MLKSNANVHNVAVTETNDTLHPINNLQCSYLFRYQINQLLASFYTISILCNQSRNMNTVHTRVRVTHTRHKIET